MNNPQANTQTPSFWEFFLEKQLFHTSILTALGVSAIGLAYAIEKSFFTHGTFDAMYATAAMATPFVADLLAFKIAISKQTKLFEGDSPEEFEWIFQYRRKELFSMPILGWFWYKKTPAFFRKFEERYQELRPVKLLEKLEGMEKDPNNLEKFLEIASEIIELSGNDHSYKLKEIIENFHDEISVKMNTLKEASFCNTICIDAYGSWNKENPNGKYRTYIQYKQGDLIIQNDLVKVNINELNCQINRLIDTKNAIAKLER